MSPKPVQQPLWSEHIYKALDDSICAIAPDNRNAYEHMAELLWPGKCDRTRYSRIKACLDPLQESTNFNPEEVIFILAQESAADLEISIRFISDSVNRHLGDKKTPRSPKAVLLDKQADIAAEAARLQKQIDRIDHADLLKAVK